MGTLAQVRPTLTHPQLKELLHYNPFTGLFTWRVARGSGVKAGDVAGSLHGEGYICIKVFGTRHRAHRLAWFYMMGEWPSEDVDHINTNRADNRWCNLRQATRAQNLHNARLSSCNNTGYKGVSRWCGGYTFTYTGQVVAHGILHRKSGFPTPEEASAWCRVTRERLHGAYARHE